MTDHNDTGATARPWRFVPSHVAEGPSEVRSPEGWLICTTSSDADAALIERTVNAYEPLKARLAEVERELVRERQTSRGDWSSQRDNDALIIELDGMKARALAAEARVAVLEKALSATLDQYVSMALSGDCGFWDPEEEYHVIAARGALAAEQKEAGK